jgi:osmoprotectant transport system substrate-binding protein
MRVLRVFPCLAAVAFVAACGGSSSGGAPSGGATVKEDKSLVVLDDPEHLQNSDNIVAVVRKDVDKAPLEAALNKVAEALTQDDLVTMNARALTDHDAPDDIAADYVDEKGLTDGLSGGSGGVTVGAANFAENEILANLYEQVLDAAGYDAKVKNVQSREVYEPALESGDLDVMPEYAATMTEFLNTKDNGPDASSKHPLASTDIDETLAALKKIGAEHGLVPLEAADATDQNAFAVRKDFAEKWDLVELGDLTNVEGDLVLGGPPECPKRPYCKPGLEKTYGVTFTGFKTLDAGGPLTRAALENGDIQIGLMFSSDPALASS